MQTHQQHFADICNSQQSEIRNKPWPYQQVKFFMYFTNVFLYYVYGLRASNWQYVREYVKDSLPNSIDFANSCGYRQSKPIADSFTYHP